MNSIERAKWNKYANDYIRKVEAFCQREIYKKFSLGSVRLDWDPKRRSSRGGMYADGPGINIAMNHLCRDHKGEIYRVYEYKSFDDHPDIGGFYTRRNYDKLDMVILHEIAHALQYYSYKINRHRCKPHGPVWKNFYSRLRNAFLNYTLENQHEMAEEYQRIKDEILGIKREPLIARAASK